ncbi:MAG: DUF58 domain-containing protein [Candidatus Tectimicrobiota bacterium]
MSGALQQGFARLMRRKGFRLLWLYGSLKLTPAGQALLLLWFVAAGQGAVEDLVLPIYHLWAFLTMVLGVAWLLSKVTVPRLRLVCRPPRPVSAGDMLVLEVEVENLSRRPVYALTLFEYDMPAGLRLVTDGESDVLPRLGAGEKAVLRLRLRAMQRGAYTLRHLYGVSAFPLGLCRGWCRTPQVASCLVYPAFTVPAFFPVPRGRRLQPGGMRSLSPGGDAAEFMHTREYRVGDNLRHIHWASWARLGKPIVKVYQEESMVRLALLLDSRATTAAEKAAFEAVVSMAAGVAVALCQQQYSPDLVAVGAVVHRLQGGHMLAQAGPILDLLACLEAVAQVDWSELSTALLAATPSVSTVVAIWMDWTPQHAACVSQLREAGVAVQSIVIRAGRTTLPTPSLPPEQFVQLAPGAALPVSTPPEFVGLAGPKP